MAPQQQVGRPRAEPGRARTTTRAGSPASTGSTRARGRRTRDQVPAVPPPGGLPEVDRRAQAALQELVESAGGRFDTRVAVPVGHVDVLVELFGAWARRHGVRSRGGLHFSGQPGLWRALDELYPLQDPNRWDQLREAVILELEKGSWRRRRPPRGAVFDILT